jgi:hypothetical protein
MDSFSKVISKLEFLNLMDIRLELKRFIFMPTQENDENRILEKLRFIQDCEQMIHDADNADKIDTLKKKLYQMICEYQECYKKAVEEAYRLNPPFPSRTDPEKERKSDYRQIFDLVQHSIIINNYELLKQYLIEPVSQKELSISPRIIIDINRLIKGAKTPIETSYFEWTKEELERVLEKVFGDIQK